MPEVSRFLFRESGCIKGETLVQLIENQTSITQPIYLLSRETHCTIKTIDKHTFNFITSSNYYFHNHGEKYVYSINIKNKNKLFLTANHKLLTVQGWSRLDNITKDILVGIMVKKKQELSLIYFKNIYSIMFSNKAAVYDLELPLFHSFIANEIIIHNSIEQDADLVCMLYRDEYYHPTSKDVNKIEIIVAKHRNGPVGSLKLKFNTNIMGFANDGD